MISCGASPVLGEGLPARRKALAWPARSGKLVLKLALDRVADFYLS